MSRFTTPFGFHSTAAEVIAGVDLAGKRAIITGGAAGIGIEIARALAIAGAAVTLAVRRPAAAAAVAEELRQSAGNSAVDVKPLVPVPRLVIRDELPLVVVLAVEAQQLAVDAAQLGGDGVFAVLLARYLLAAANHFQYLLLVVDVTGPEFLRLDFRSRRCLRTAERFSDCCRPRLR